jgi:hypothetical protein
MAVGRGVDTGLEMGLASTITGPPPKIRRDMGHPLLELCMIFAGGMLSNRSVCWTAVLGWTNGGQYADEHRDRQLLVAGK